MLVKLTEAMGLVLWYECHDFARCFDQHPTLTTPMNMDPVATFRRLSTAAASWPLARTLPLCMPSPGQRSICWSTPTWPCSTSTHWAGASLGFASLAPSTTHGRWVAGFGGIRVSGFQGFRVWDVGYRWVLKPESDWTMAPAFGCTPTLAQCLCDGCVGIGAAACGQVTGLTLLLLCRHCDPQALVQIEMQGRGFDCNQSSGLRVLGLIPGKAGCLMN